jgi:hypothetical protein
MSAISGQKTVTTAGTAVALGSNHIHGPLIIKALSTNTGLVYVGNTGAGDVDSSNRFLLSANECIIYEHVSQLSAIYIDSAVNGEGVSWCALDI